MSATTTNVDSGKPRPANEKFMWHAGDVVITKADPNKVWNTSYIDDTAAEVLVRDGEEMILHCQQNAADQPIQTYLEAFIKTPQGKLMPTQVRGDLAALGVI